VRPPLCRLPAPPPCLPWPYAVAVAAACAPVADRSLAAPVPLGLAILLVASVAPLLCAVDAASLRLPDALVLPVAAGALVLVAMSGPGFGRALAGGAVLGGFHLLTAVLPGSALGFGDVKVAALLGLVLGRLGWSAVGLGALVPYLLAGPVALAMLAGGRAHGRSGLPFGPYLLAGALFAVLADV
jgi:leader peptidase (prepilin peptidase)/N-methyltransferase